VLVGVQTFATRALQGLVEGGLAMTIFLQVLLLIGLLLTGAALVLGLLQESGSMLMVGTYFGWFMAAASLASYFFLVILLMLRGTMPAWGRLSLVNMGLSLIGISLLGLDSHSVGLSLLAAVMLGLAFSLPAGLLKVFDTRTSIAGVGAIVLFTALSPLVKVWALIAMCVGVTFVGSQLVLFMRQSRANSRAD